MKSVLKYTAYAIISIFLLVLPFLLLPLPIFRADDLNPLLLLFVINPLLLVFQGIVSEIMLCKKAKIVYILFSPFIGIILITAFYFACDSAASFTFSGIVSVVEQLFTYPMTVFSVIYVISGWLGVIAVKIFRKLRVVLSPLFKYEK